MSKLDLFRPHRFLINPALRKEAEKLRAHIDEYQAKYEAHYQKCNEEIEQTKQQLDREYQEAKENMIECLKSYELDIQELSDAIATYITAYFSKKLTEKKQEINSAQLTMVREYVEFLSNQMREIGNEIDLLKARIDTLSNKADISDIIELIQISGNVLPVDDIHDAKGLMDLVSARMEMVDRENHIEWNILLNAKSIIAERISYVAEIQYISWVIQQKIQLSKELSTHRRTQKNLEIVLSEIADQLQIEITSLNSTLQATTRKIRFYWAKPIIQIDVDIADCYSKLRQLKDEKSELHDKKQALYDKKDDVQHDIDRMIDDHSSDSSRWESLQRDKSDLKDDIGHIKSEIESIKSDLDSCISEIDSLKSQKKKWLALKKTIEGLMKQHHVFLLKAGNRDQYDDEAYAAFRLSELRDIVDKGRQAALLEYKAEQDELQSQKTTLIQTRDKAISAVQQQIDNEESKLKAAVQSLATAKQNAQKSAKATIQEIEKKQKKQKAVLQTAQQKLSDIQKADTRPAIIRFFSDTPEISKAKEAVENAKKRLKEIEVSLSRAKAALNNNDFSNNAEVKEAQKKVSSIQQNIAKLKKQLQVLKDDYVGKIKQVDDQIQSLKPHPKRPTKEEQREISLIETWLRMQANHSNRRRKR